MSCSHGISDIWRSQSSLNPSNAVKQQLKDTFIDTGMSLLIFLQVVIIIGNFARIICPG